MRSSDWKMISTFGYVLGMLSLGGVILAIVYSERNWIGLTVYPYHNYIIHLLTAGIVLLVIGYVTEQRAKEDIQLEKQQHTPDIGFCPKCGTKRDFSAHYCKKCGKKFD